MRVVGLFKVRLRRLRRLRLCAEIIISNSIFLECLGVVTIVFFFFFLVFFKYLALLSLLDVGMCVCLLINTQKQIYFGDVALVAQPSNATSPPRRSESLYKFVDWVHLCVRFSVFYDIFASFLNSPMFFLLCSCFY